MSNSTAVNLCLETPCENEIQEITYDGTEIYQPSLTLSETLAKFADRIDFSEKLDEELAKGDKSLDEDGKDPSRFYANIWPWDAVRTKLKDAFSEICVLSDLLAIAGDKRYLVLDPVAAEPEAPKPIFYVFARKKALASAANILLSGAERMRTIQNEHVNQNVSDFHLELLRLRQNWRIRKTANGIVGDVSYRTAGSKFGMSGAFDVTEAEEVPEEYPNAGSSASVSPKTKATSALRVNLPPELRGSVYLQITTQKDQQDLCTTTIGKMDSNEDYYFTPNSGIWQKTLERAQNVVFCKELFEQLTKEAVQLQAPIPHVIIGNEIRASLLPGIQLMITLCHSTSDANENVQTDTVIEHDRVLEHSLHQLLHEAHHKESHLAFPHPSSGPLVPNKKRMLAGPMTTDRHEMLQMTKSQTIFEQIIARAQHIFMRKRTQYVLDTLARDVKDPQIVSHWNALNSPTMSCVKINIVTQGYDTINRTSLVIHVQERSLKCICRDGRVMHLSYEPQELRDLVLCQINQHQISCVLNMARCMAWQVISNSNHLGIGEVEPLGSASSCLLSSPNGDRMMAVKIRCDPQIEVKVYIARSPRQDFFPSPLVPEKYWENLGGHFKEVRFDKIEGKSFLSKMEYLMASLASSSS